MSEVSVPTGHVPRRRRRLVPPGPNPLTEIPRSPANDREIFTKLVQAHQEWGDVVRVGFLGFTRYFVTHPDGVQHVLHDNYRNYGKDCFEYAGLRLMIGEGLVTSDGELWRRQRRLAAPAFTPRCVHHFADDMTVATRDLLDRWEARARSGEPFDVTPEMMGVTLRIVGDALFGVDTSGDSAAVAPAFATAMRVLIGRTPLAPPLWVPTPANVRFNSAMRMLRGVVERILEARRKNGGAESAGRSDLLSSLIAARDEETGEAMGRDQVRDEVLTLLLAGHETTAMALTWCWYLLSKHPDVRRRLCEEVDAVLGGRAPTAADLPSLAYGRMVIEETMRLYPPVWAIARVAREADEVGGYPIRPGRVLLLSPYSTHRRPDFWENPEGFDPERFAPERARKQHRFAYFPFAAGPRVCIGNNFALIEAQLILAMVAQRYVLDLVPGRPVEPQALLTMRPRDGMWMTVRRRRSGRA